MNSSSVDSLLKVILPLPTNFTDY